MYENDFMYAVERSPEYLAHYGIRGMKWGVRKAIASGNSARLGRQYAKAQKKLAKLEKRASKTKKYARRAALMGAGAAAAGGLAVAGTSGVAKLTRGAGKIGRNAMAGIGGGMNVFFLMIRRPPRSTPGLSGKVRSRLASGARALETGGSAVKGASTKVRGATASAANQIAAWGGRNTIGRGIQNKAGALAGKYGAGKGAMFNTAARDRAREATKGIAGASNNTIARIGAGVVGAGLAAGAAKNAYRAATAKKKAERFRSEMNKAFAGTKYANGGQPRQGKKRRRK